MPFRLDHALEAWHRSLAFRRVLSDEDRRELEAHVRDHVDALVARGYGEEEAFHEAIRAVGDVAQAEAEYGKVYWEKAVRRRTLRHELTHAFAMLKNYVTIALRTLGKAKGYAVINVTGLAVGLACCLLIFLLVRHEWSFDRFHANIDRIYRTSLVYVGPDGTTNYQNMMTPDFTPAMVADVPGIEHATRYVLGQDDLQVGSDVFRQQLVEVDAPFFEIFSFPFLAGDPATAVADPSGLVLTAETATAFFGVRDGTWDEALGQTVSLTRSEVTYDFTVTGVMADLPPNSSFQFDAALSFENYDEIQLGGNNWGGRTSTYVLLEEGVDPAAFETRLADYVDTEYEPYREALLANNMVAEADEAFEMTLQPLPEMHLTPDVWVPYEASPHDPLYSYILAGIGLLVLLIACINFMTLSVSRSASRAREVGLRKVMGAQRGQLMRQFWGEALLLTVFGLGLGFVLAVAALPFFNDLTGKTLALSTFAWYELALAAIALLGVVGLVAGGYPAAVLSRYQPATVLKGAVAARGNTRLTRGLVVLQYTLSIGLIVGTLLMAQQLHFLLNKDLGYDDEQVLVVHTGQVSRADAPRLLEHAHATLLPYDAVTHVARAGYSFTRGSDRNTWRDADGITRSAYNFGVDYDYLDLMGMELAAGRFFSRDYPSDPTRSVLVNEALVRDFELEEPVGTVLTGWLDSIYEESPVVIGVVKDFNYRSLKQDVAPAVMNMHPDYYNYMGALLVRFKPGATEETVARAEAAWNDVLAGKPFSYSFLDEDLAQMYETERRWSRIVTVSALFAVLIACLGLFGLATLSVTRRTKEIGVRKVLGASVPRLMALVARDFLVLVGVAAALAWPLAYLGARRWLDTFAYQIDIGPLPFVGAGLLALVIAVATVSTHAVRAATADPVQALRYE